jgi:hypothetical protein
MGKLRSGILGPVSGKVSGVVGASWKGISYLRGYAVPSPSDTELQQAQRSDFAVAVSAAKAFIGPVFNQYSDRFISRRSGYNKFVADNIKKVDESDEIPLPIVTNGPLYPGSELVATYVTGTGTLNMEWDASLGVDGADTDVAISWMRDKSTNAVAFATPVTRVDAASTVTSAAFAGLTLADVEGGLFFAKKSGALVVKISNSLVVAAVD